MRVTWELTLKEAHVRLNGLLTYVIRYFQKISHVHAWRILMIWQLLRYTIPVAASKEDQVIKFDASVLLNMRSIISAISQCRVNSIPAHKVVKRISLPSTTSKFPTCHRDFSKTHASSRQAADDPNFTSIIDNPPNLIRTGRRHGPGLIILGKSPKGSNPWEKTL